MTAWLDRAAYPFEAHRLDVGAGRVHYVDEGDGAPVLMVHGTPTWSFLYRHLILGLRGRHRCVVPDHLGFGLSDRPAGFAYRPEDHARNLAVLVERLGLKDLTLVVHDYGGPIGLAYALDRPENVRRLVLFNTWMWSFAGDRRLERFGRIFGSPVGRWLYERHGFSVRVLFRHAVRDKTRYTPAVHAQYAHAVADRGARHATWVLAREVLGSSAWLDGLWRRRERIAKIPALLVWGLKDPAFGSFLSRCLEVFERAQVVELDDVGHVPQEERGPEVAALVARFLEDTEQEERR